MGTRSLKSLVCSLIAGLLLGAAPAAHAAGIPFLTPSQAVTVPPVAAPVSADPAGPVRGTIVLVHGGAWAGHSARGQQLLMSDPGRLFLERGWRIASVDMDEGTAGIDGVLSAVDAEVAAPASNGPLCIYGESAGAELALVAAARRPVVDCVVGIGTPADLAQMQADGDTSADVNVQIAGEPIKRFFGTTPESLAPWNPVALAPSIRADVLLLHEIDDPLVPSVHAARYQAVQPTTQVVELEPGDPADPATKFRHGTVSELGRARYAGALGSFADQALLREDAEQRAAAAGCASAADHVVDVGLTRVQRALRCLARKDAALRGTVTGRWQRTAINVRGEVDAARIWARMRETVAGRRSLAALAARHAKLAVRVGARSRVTLRCTPGARH